MLVMPERHHNVLWLVKDVELMSQRLRELEDDEHALRLFVGAQRKNVEEKQDHAQRCKTFFSNLSGDRSRELEDARARRMDA